MVKLSMKYIPTIPVSRPSVSSSKSLDIRQLLTAYQQSLRERASLIESVVMPGYTHMRRAMPTDAGTWLSAFAGMAGDDLALLESIMGLNDRSPLGTGAGYGIPLLDLDREMTAGELEFATVQENPIHAHLCRGKEEGTILSVLTSIMLGLNKNFYKRFCKTRQSL